MGAISDRSGELHCGGKVRYASRPRAELAARTLFRETGLWCRSYGCAYCLAWHLGDLSSYTDPVRPERLDLDWAGEQRAA
jgi:hypothetical protein